MAGCIPPPLTVACFVVTCPQTAVSGACQQLSLLFSPVQLTRQAHTQHQQW
jgi:hypothetical protein